MAAFLRAEMAIGARVTPLHDRPPRFFTRTGVEAQHDLFVRLSDELAWPFALPDAPRDALSATATTEPRHSALLVLPSSCSDADASCVSVGSDAQGSSVRESGGCGLKAITRPVISTTAHSASTPTASETAKTSRNGRRATQSPKTPMNATRATAKADTHSP